MRKFRFTISGLMAVVLVLAFGLAALKNAGATWAGVMPLLTYGLLGLAFIGIVLRGQAERAWWLGFFVFGWGYLQWASRLFFGHVSTTILMVWLREESDVADSNLFNPRNIAFFQVADCLWALLVAILGGLLARAFFATTAVGSPSPEPPAHEADRTPGKRWFRPAVLGLASLIVFGSVVAIKSTTDSGIWAGGMYLLTCGLLGTAILGALFSRGKSREICIGAALFGVGYLYMALAYTRDSYFERPRPYLVTDQFLNAIRPRAPQRWRGTPSNAPIVEALERPIPMHFPDWTPFKDVLKYIKQATATPTCPSIPIYVDPLGLQEVERSLDSTIRIDVEGVPLKATLRTCLNQLGLTYYVEDSCLQIISQDSEDIIPESDDPFLIAGHCLIALIAAAIGGVIAPVVSALHRERPGPGGTADAPAPAPSH